MMFDDTLISIHAPTRGATILCNHRGLVFGFQSTLPREERQCRAKSAEAASKFQSTLPREERPSVSCHVVVYALFQSTLPREERPTTHAASMSSNVYFNPRSHERSDYMRNGYENATCISIHAPTRGATVSNLPAYAYVKISIHAPTRGATIQHLKAYANTVFQSTLPREERLPRRMMLIWLFYFNPRSHERSDLDAIGKGISIMISIHAPTRGATLAQSA